MRPTKALRSGLLATALGVAMAAGCKDNPILGPGMVEGTWSVSDSTGTVVLVITEDSVFEYDEDPIADCYEYVAYEVIEIDGRDFRLGTIGDTVRVELHRDDEELVVVVGNREVRYAASGTDPGSLPLCPPPSVSATCAELPGLTIDGAVEGSITGSDPENPDGTHYDLYRLDVAAADSLEIELSSSVDSYLNLFDSLGGFIAANDDASNRTLDARIRREFDTGCYIVMATTSFASVFGDYELSVSTE